MINKLGMQETLCWSCAHAVPEEKKGRGCSWSLDFHRSEDGRPSLRYTGRERKFVGQAILLWIAHCFGRDSCAYI